MVAHVNARLGSLCKWRKQRLAGLDLTAKTGLACRILGSFSATLSLLIINLPPTQPNRPATHPPTHPPTRHLAALPGSPLSTPGGGREGGDRDGTGREEEEGENSGGKGGRGRRRQRQPPAKAPDEKGGGSEQRRPVTLRGVMRIFSLVCRAVWGWRKPAERRSQRTQQYPVYLLQQHFFRAVLFVGETGGGWIQNPPYRESGKYIFVVRGTSSDRKRRGLVVRCVYPVSRCTLE